jgi:hypothetical protein
VLTMDTMLMFHWSAYKLFVLNTGWNRDSLQMMIFVNVCPTWSMVPLKRRFQTSITWNDVYGVSFFHLYYLIPLTAYLYSQRTPYARTNYFMLDWSIYTLFVPNRRWKHATFQIMIFVYVCSTWNIVELRNAFWDLNNKKWHKWCMFV